MNYLRMRQFPEHSMHSLKMQSLLRFRNNLQELERNTEMNEI